MRWLPLILAEGKSAPGLANEARLQIGQPLSIPLSIAADRDGMRVCAI